MKDELTQEDLQLVRNWRIFEDKVVLFQNKANILFFQDIYGIDEGNRLIDHFVNRCKKDFKEFLTFLTRDQYNDTLIFMLNNL